MQASMTLNASCRAPASGMPSLRRAQVARRTLRIAVRAESEEKPTVKGGEISAPCGCLAAALALDGLLTAGGGTGATVSLSDLEAVRRFFVLPVSVSETAARC